MSDSEAAIEKLVEAVHLGLSEQGRLKCGGEARRYARIALAALLADPASAIEALGGEQVYAGDDLTYAMRTSAPVMSFKRPVFRFPEQEGEGEAQAMSLIRMSEWDIPRTVAAVKAKVCPRCVCDPVVHFEVDPEVRLVPVHDEGCPEQEGEGG